MRTPRRIMLIRLNTMAPKKADQKPATAKPGTKKAASCSIKALMTRKNSPKLSNDSGKVTIFKMKPKVELIRPIMTGPARIATQPLIEMVKQISDNK